MNEPQVWTLIGVFAASTFAMMGLMSTLFVNVINAKFERVDEQFARVDATMNARFDGLHGEMNARFGRVDSKIDHLDKDVQTLFRRVFPDAG